MAETNSLLNCRTRKGTGGSNPPLSAMRILQDIDYQSCRIFFCPKKCTKNAPNSVATHFYEFFQISYIPYESGFVVSGEECTLKDIRQAVSSVANEYRIPFSMHIAGYKYEEIAAFMNLPIGTVKSRIYYTRKKLQFSLQDYKKEY